MKVGIAQADFRVAVFPEVSRHGSVGVERIRIDELEAHAARAELLEQPRDFRRVPVRQGTIDADENQHGHRKRTCHLVLKLRQIVSQWRRAGNDRVILCRNPLAKRGTGVAGAAYSVC